MLDASINKAQPTMFVNIGLQNDVLLRTVLDPIHGKLTDTRTRYNFVCYFRFLVIDFLSSGFRHEACQAHSGANSWKSCYPGLVVSFMVKLCLPEPHAFHAFDLR